MAEHLADQLLLPMALAGSGGFTTTHLSEHLQSNIQVIEAFCPVAVRCTPTGTALRVEVGGATRTCSRPLSTGERAVP